MRMKFTKMLPKLALILGLASLTAASSCANEASLEISNVPTCTALRADLFQMSSRDTPESRDGYANFINTFEAVCGE